MLDRDPNSFWVNLWLVPLGILLRVFAIAVWMNIGTILMDYKIRFEHLFRISLVSFCVFALGRALYTLLILYSDIQSIDDAMFYRFSLLELLGKDQVHRLLIYPLSIFTVYQVLFGLAFNLGLACALDKPFRKTLPFTACCYALALITWALFVLFLGLNLFN